MTKKDWFGILYVSTWVVIWGSIGSLVDFPLLQAEIYNAGSVGQATTFALTAILSVIIAIFSFKKILNLGIIVSIMGMDSNSNVNN